MGKLMGRRESLDVQPATRRYYDAPERSRQTQPQRRRQRLENKRNIELGNRLEYVDQTGAVGYAWLQSKFAMHALGSCNSVEASGGDG
jgi:hypothetical protein